MSFDSISQTHRLARVRRFALCTLAASFTGCQCTSNEQGFLQAPQGGDLTYALAERQPLHRRISAACGRLGPLSPSSVERAPYLQNVDDVSATVAWTSSESDVHLRYWAASAPTSVSDVASTLDDSAPLTGRQQFLAELLPLEPGALYCYELAQADVIVFRGGFQSAPSPESSIRFAAMGDVGKDSSDQRAVREQLASVQSDFLVITGDVAYDDGRIEQYEAYFFAVYAELLSVLPVFPASGNHDHRTLDALPFQQVFVLPENGGAEGKERWYSFDWGPVHVAVLDTELELDAQASWLLDDLADSERPWNIVVLHKPPYSSGAHGDSEAVIAGLVPAFVEGGVDLVLAGHDHSYERTEAIDGVHYVITGGGGRGTRPVGTSAFTAFSARVAHFVYLEANPTELTLHAIDATGNEFDSMRLTR